MLAAFGLQHASMDMLLSIVLFAVVASIITGWATDAVMNDAGFGVIGNSILSLLGALIGVWTLATWLHMTPLGGSNFINVILFGAGGAMVTIIALAFVRKMIQRA